MATHPKDEFDEFDTHSTRVGAHRSPPPRGRGWITFAWAALATGVIVAGGVLAVNVLGSKDDSALDSPSTSSSTPVPTATPLTDPSLIASGRTVTVTILNGSTTVDLDKVASKQLTKVGWPVTTSTDADQDTIKKTTVYYYDDKNEDVARGIAIALGAKSVAQNDNLPGASVTVVLGADYAKAHSAG